MPMQLETLNKLIDEFAVILERKDTFGAVKLGKDDSLTKLFLQITPKEALKLVIFLNQEVLLGVMLERSWIWDHVLASVAFHYGWLEWVEVVYRRRNPIRLVKFASQFDSSTEDEEPLANVPIDLLLYPNDLLFHAPPHGTPLISKTLLGSHRKVADIIDFMRLVKQPLPSTLLLECMVERGWTCSDVARLPLMWRLPLRSILLEYKENPPNYASNSKIYHLIGRPDVAFNAHGEIPNPNESNPDKGLQIKSCSQPFEDMNELFHTIQSLSSCDKKDISLLDLYGKDPVVQARFSKDKRTEEVQRILCSNNPVVLRSNENEPEANQQVFQTTQMVHLSKRSFSQLFGRALYTFGAESRSTANLGAFRYKIPPLNVSAVFLPFKSPVNLNSYDGATQPNNNNGSTGNSAAISATHGLPSEYFLWPEFHHGVSLALQIPPGKGLDEIDASWIQSHRPIPELDSSAISSGSSSTWATHAGFVYGLGLLGYLESFSTVDIYQYLLLNQEIMSTSILLGCCIGKRGSMDQKMSRLCSIHISSLLPPLSDLPTANFLTTAAMLGLGFLYQGTCHRRMSEVMLFELSRQDLFGILICPASTTTTPQPASELGNGSSILASDPCQSFKGFSEWYALSAGFALGLITLGKGAQAAGLSDLFMEDQLRKCIHGTQDFGGWSSSAFVQKNSGTRSGGFGYPGVSSIGSDPRSHHQNFPHQNSSLNSQYPDGHGAGRRVRSHGILNTEVSGPAAIAALTLMHFASNNGKAAKILSLPDTAYGISLLKPDTILLLAFCRPLIEWNSMAKEANLLAWLQSQIPPYIKSYLKSETSISLDEKRRGNMSFPLIQSYYSVLAGLSLALGLRYVGTNDEEVVKLLSKIAISFKDELKKYNQRRNAPLLLSYSQRITLLLLQKCLGLCVLAECLVKAGSGDLGLLTWLRQQHGQWGRDVPYGLQVMNHMSIGFLFIGGALGSITNPTNFKNWLNSRAYLFMSIWPIFPSSPQDNQYHLQALRHLWSLSCTVNPVIVRDAENPLKLIPAMVTLSEQQQQRQWVFNAPCPFPTSIYPESAIFTADGYWPLRITNPTLQLKNVFLLRKSENNEDETAIESLMRKAETFSPEPLQPYELLELVAFTDMMPMSSTRKGESDKLVSTIRYKLQRLSETWYNDCREKVKSLLYMLASCEKPLTATKLRDWRYKLFEAFHCDPRIPLLFTYHRLSSFSCLETCLKEVLQTQQTFHQCEEETVYLNLIMNHGMSPKQADLIAKSIITG